MSVSESDQPKDQTIDQIDVAVEVAVQVETVAPDRGPVSMRSAGMRSAEIRSEKLRPANDGVVPGTKLDRLAIMMSGACLVHCLAIPISVLLLPAVSEPLLGTETTVHWLLLGLAIPVSVWALSAGYKRHRYTPSLVFGAVGLTCMFLGVSHVFGHAFELPLTIVGVVLVLVAHVQNLRSHAGHRSH